MSKDKRKHKYNVYQMINGIAVCVAQFLILQEARDYVKDKNLYTTWIED